MHNLRREREPENLMLEANSCDEEDEKFKERSGAKWNKWNGTPRARSHAGHITACVKKGPMGFPLPNTALQVKVYATLIQQGVSFLVTAELGNIDYVVLAYTISENGIIK